MKRSQGIFSVNYRNLREMITDSPSYGKWGKSKHCSNSKMRFYHKADVVYRGTSTNNPEESYVGETSLISTSRFEQHEDPSHNSAPSKFLQENPGDRFQWEILSTSSSNWLKRKIHEALLQIETFFKRTSRSQKTSSLQKWSDVESDVRWRSCKGRRSTVVFSVSNVD